MVYSFSIHWGQETYVTALSSRVYNISQFDASLDFPQKLIHKKYKFLERRQKKIRAKYIDLLVLEQ